MSDTRETVAEFWIEVLDLDEVADADTLLGVGGDSLTATMIANRVELAWGLRPSMEEMLTLSFGDLVAQCDRHRDGPAS